LVPATKNIGENATSFRRCVFAVVEPHSRSTSPDGRGHRCEGDLDLHAVELGRHVLDNLAADIDRVADRLLQPVQIRERQRAFAIADGDFAGVLDLLERPRPCPDADRILG
jgi:hypothetical protein